MTIPTEGPVMVKCHIEDEDYKGVMHLKVTNDSGGDDVAIGRVIDPGYALGAPFVRGDMIVYSDEDEGPELRGVLRLVRGYALDFGERPDADCSEEERQHLLQSIFDYGFDVYHKRLEMPDEMSHKDSILVGSGQMRAQKRANRKEIEGLFGDKFAYAVHTTPRMRWGQIKFYAPAVRDHKAPEFES